MTVSQSAYVAFRLSLLEFVSQESVTFSKYSILQEPVGHKGSLRPSISRSTICRDITVSIKRQTI